MKKIFIVISIFISWWCSLAYCYDFDQLSKPDNHSETKKTTMASVKDQSELSLNRQKGKWDVEDQERAEKWRKLMSSGSGSGGNTSSEHTSDSSYCGSGDVCFQVIRNKDGINYGDTFIKCIKGPSTGEEKCISYSKSTGKYATGCFVANGHHYTQEYAGNSACSY